MFAYKKIGILLAEQGKLQEAIDTFYKAIESNKLEIDKEMTKVFAYEKIGVLLAEQGKLQEAIDTFYKAIESNEHVLQKNDISAVHKCLGIALIKQNKNAEAIEHLNKAVEGLIQQSKDSPKSLQVCENLAGSYTALAQAAGAIGKTEDTLAAHKGAINTYNIAARLDPANVNYYVEAIKALLYIGEPDQAIKLLDRAIAAMLKDKQKDQADALRQFRNNILQQLQAPQ